MSSYEFSTPVVLAIFKRPHTTKKVFEAIQKVQPKKLFIIADGPRLDRSDEIEKCKATRNIVEQVDWDCEILKNYSDINLGCERRMSSGLDWVFSLADKAIILEDDCVPHPTFFRFCDELLNYYSDDKRIMSISALSAPFSHRYPETSYCFSRYNRCWGWASWRRAWEHYDYSMKAWPEILERKFIEDLLGNQIAAKDWSRIFQATYERRINSWAYRWTLACWLQSGLSILPNCNLVSNIGFSSDATHTKNSKSQRAHLPLEEMKFPVQHPSFVIRDAQVDSYLQRTIHSPSSVGRIKSSIKSFLNL